MFNPIDLVSELFKTELENTGKLFPGHDPFSGHRKGDEGARSTVVEPYDPGTWVDPDEATVDETVRETDSVRIPAASVGAAFRCAAPFGSVRRPS